MTWLERGNRRIEPGHILISIRISELVLQTLVIKKSQTEMRPCLLLLMAKFFSQPLQME